MESLKKSQGPNLRGRSPEVFGRAKPEGTQVYIVKYTVCYSVLHYTSKSNFQSYGKGMAHYADQFLAPAEVF